MNILKAIVAGLFFGAWPLFMNRSGLMGNISAAAFSLMCIVFVLPFAGYQMYQMYQQGGDFSQANLPMIAWAGLTGTIGMLFFSSMTSNTAPAQLGLLLLITSMGQTVMPALYHVWINGMEAVTLRQGLGFILATLAIWLLR